MKNEISRREIIEKITPLVENTAMRYNVVPVEIDFAKENHRWFVRIFLFSYEHEINLEDCENVSRSLNDFLDEMIPVKYYLEVSSPGLDRKFKSDREYIIFNGKNISIKLKKPFEGEEERIFKGKIIDFDEHQGLRFLRFEDNKEFLIPKDNIQSAKLYIEE